MKRLGVAGIIRSGGKHSLHILMGRRGKDPNRGLFVLPGGGVQEGESLEQAFQREIKEETGLEIWSCSERWARPDVIELPDRLILVAHASVMSGFNLDDTPKDGSDLYDVGWFNFNDLPDDISPVVVPVLASWGFTQKRVNNG
jgi:8-oxo-dGTP diphosphatase